MGNVNAYEESSDKLLIDQFIMQYQPLVKKIALYIKRRLPSHVELDDILQSGLVGLLEARNTFKAGLGASFETYASIRIRGAMIDSLRRNSWVSRDTIKNMKKISNAIRAVEQRTQKPATAEEIANELDISVSEYHKISQDVSFCSVLSLDEMEQDGAVIDGQSENPFEVAQSDVEKNAVKKILVDLPEREQLLLSLYYVEEFTFKQIGEILDLTEARVCQLHSQAIARVRSKMNKSNKALGSEKANH